MDRLTYSDIARLFGTGLIATGVGLLLFVAVTVTWGDPFTKLGAERAQDDLTRELATFARGAAPLRPAPVTPEVSRALALQADKSTPLGHAAGTLSIPALDLRRVVVNGARTKDLEQGPGIYAETGFPGSGTPVAIAGHRTTYGAPFLDIDELEPGDDIVLDMPYGRFTYEVTRRAIVDDHDWSVIDIGAAEARAGTRRAAARGRCSGGTCEHLVLTACHPKYSAEQRIAVFARPARVELREVGR